MVNNSAFTGGGIVTRGWGKSFSPYCTDIVAFPLDNITGRSRIKSQLSCAPWQTLITNAASRKKLKLFSTQKCKKHPFPMAIYIEESFFRPILDPWTHGPNRALFIPAANEAGNPCNLRNQLNPLSDKRVRRAADGWTYLFPVTGSPGTLARPATLGPAPSYPISSLKIETS